MTKKKQTLSLLDLKGKISFVDEYDYKIFRIRRIFNASGEVKRLLGLLTDKLLPRIY